MTILDDAMQIAKNAYALQVESDGIVALQNAASARRGIFKVRGSINGEEKQGVLRMSREDCALAGFTGTAHVLAFLEQHVYPAPRLICTAGGQNIGECDEWHALFTTYLPGHPVSPGERTVFEMARRLGELHRLPLPATPLSALPDSRWNTAQLPDQALKHLMQSSILIPSDMQALHQALCEVCQRAMHHRHLQIGIVHGDAWHMNAIDGEFGVAFIDWDWAGVGESVFDLATLLVTIHYDLSRPDHIEPSPNLIDSALNGYREARSIAPEEKAALLDFMPFYLAYQFSRYYAGGISIYEDETLLRKWKRRFEATFEIAEIVHRLL